MQQIFEPTEINGMELKNRLVRSATWEGLADGQGRVTDPLVRIYEDLALGGVGLIISSYMYIEVGGRQNPTQIAVDRDEMIGDLGRLARAVHERGGKLVGQIVHCGGQVTEAGVEGRQSVAPSAVDSPGYPATPRALSTGEVERIIEQFGDAAARLKEAGFDGVQLHGAHGYLLAQFLSPSRNRRDDRFGGNLESRARFAQEVYRAVRERVGDSFPTMIKLNGHDFLEGSTEEEDSTYLSRALVEAGIDAIEVSGGTPGSGKLGAARKDILLPEDEAYFLPQARAIRGFVPRVPLMLVGGLRTLATMERVLAAGDADYFSMCRPLIREPDLPARWQRGEKAGSPCVSCLKCFGPTRKGEGLRCMQL